MTAAALTARPAGPRVARFRHWRALRLEIRHSPVVWVLPVLAVLFYFNAYRKAAGYPPTWAVGASVITGPNLVFFSVVAAGIAAWVATRESRRKTGDLLATTARAAWARQATVLAATAFWMVLAYLAGVAVIYVQTARLATWGGPPLWPVAVGVAGVAASCAVGFTCGTLLPGRFTAPAVAVAVFAAWFIGVAAANGVNNANGGMKGTAGLLVPVNGGRPPLSTSASTTESRRTSPSRSSCSSAECCWSWPDCSSCCPRRGCPVPGTALSAAGGGRPWWPPPASRPA